MAKEPVGKDEPEKEEGAGPDGSPLDLSDAGVKRMIKAAKKRGYVTMDELNEVLPSEQVSGDQIEDIMAMLNDMGINVVETEEAEEGEKKPAAADDDDDESEGGEVAPSPRAGAIEVAKAKEPVDRTDDPVRMYLREMGAVELLSREGEIAIATRIEAGREAMIAGLCESPLTFQAIIIWRDELNAAKVLLREIIDLEATYAGPDGKQVPKVEGAPDPLAEPPPPPPRGDMDGDAPPPEAMGEDMDDEFEGGISLSAMEAELKPKVLETFDRIA
ncbi:MAG: RNA polymerase sigma factor region1.1 domain-containing protein, partial [Beijerinckiaceae bacterium]